MGAASAPPPPAPPYGAGLFFTPCGRRPPSLPPAPSSHQLYTAMDGRSPLPPPAWPTRQPPRGVCPVLQGEPPPPPTDQGAARGGGVVCETHRGRAPPPDSAARNSAQPPWYWYMAANRPRGMVRVLPPGKGAATPDGRSHKKEKGKKKQGPGQAGASPLEATLPQPPPRHPYPPRGFPSGRTRWTGQPGATARGSVPLSRPSQVPCQVHTIGRRRPRSERR